MQTVNNPSQHTASAATYANVFWAVLLVTFVIKLALCVMIPITGDEAYYAIWGEYPALGYYDHTPFIGWLLFPFVQFGHHPLILRLPVVIMTSLIGWMIYQFLHKHDAQKAALTSILFLISPLSLCGVIITTDTPVILFSFLSGLCVLQALQKEDHLGWYALGGIFLGLAFFSKYFAVLLGLAYIVALFRLQKRRLLGLLILLLGVLPFGLENLYWNYTHAWANILFNIYNRNAAVHFGIGTVIVYVLTLVYIVTPPLFYYVFIKRRRYLLAKHQPQDQRALGFIITIPLIFFLILSTFKEIGLHWPLSFITFIYLWAGLCLNSAELQKSLKFMYWFTGAHLLLIIIAISFPMQTWQKLPLSDKSYQKMVYLFKHKEIRDYLNRYNQTYRFTSMNYSQADIMFYDSGIYTPTFGAGSVHGRQDDLMTDFRTLAQQNLLVFSMHKPHPEEYVPYFAQSTVHQFSIDGATFYYILGTDFNYPAYRDTVLRYIDKTYWQIPDYLPHKPSFFCEKYFAAEGCR